jgi:hypothetical protein
VEGDESRVTVDLDLLAKLRDPFPAEAISKLPKGVAKEGDAQACNICHGYHRRASVHLDYVGHAALTARLLDVDPEWNWEPFALDDRGLPALERNQDGNPVGLWIRLTVAGLTRPGYGSVESAKSEAVKELIGDALRNAAMRFGAALDLWHKGELPQQPDDPPDPDEMARLGTNRLKAETLELVGGDKDRASALWSETLERFGLTADAVVPLDAQDTVRVELKANSTVETEEPS